MKILIGCDPEIAIRNPNSGKFVSAEGLIPGTKKSPHKVKKGIISVDGFAAEIGIDPASSPEEFADNVETVLDVLKTEYLSGYELVVTDHVIFDEDVFKGQSKAGRELGCEPDFNAYSGVHNPIPVPNPKTLRCMGGHIHIGWGDSYDALDPGHFADCQAVTKQMDVFLGHPSMLWSAGTVRRSLYGKASAFRVKPYGAEYRTMDNSWLKSRDRMIFTAKNAIEAMTRLYAGEHVYQKYNPVGFIDRPGSCSERDHKRYLDAFKVPYLDDVPKEKKPKKPTGKSASYQVLEDEIMAGMPIGNINVVNG